MTRPLSWASPASWPSELARRLLPPAKRLHRDNKRLRREVEALRGEVGRLEALAEERARAPAPPPVPPRMLPFWRVPVLVNSFNRLESLRRLVDWLVRAGHERVIVVDNASTYPPLRRYLAELEERRATTVVRLESNVGHLALWRCGLLDRLGIASEYVYTDPDVVPAAFCPRDLVGRLQAVLADNPRIATAGVGLRLDDLPDGYGHKAQVLAWERQFWLAPAAPGLFHAPIDTTFALYRPGSGHALGMPAVRTGWPCLAAHEGWYLDHAAPTEEDLFYRRTAAAGTTHWSAPEIPARLQAAVAEREACRPCLLHAGATGVGLPGYLPAPVDGSVPLAAASVDGVYVDHGLGWLNESPARLAELRRVAKRGALLVLHASGPTPEELAGLLDGPRVGAAGWRVERLTLVPDGRFQACAATDLLRLARQSPGALRGMMLHLRADDVPAAGAELALGAVGVAPGTLDAWGGFARVG